MGKYRDELIRAMTWLGEQPDTFFLGQAVGVKGTAMFGTLENVPMEKRLELPVFENTQLGMSVGMAVNGTVPISIFPRWNFLLCACDQLVNHLDKLATYSHGEYKPKVIIRTGIGSQRPMHPQAQHIGDFTAGFQKILTNIDIIRCDEPEDIFHAYELAYRREDGKSTIIVEWGDFHNEK